MAVVVDTDVVSFLYKRDTRAMLYRPHLDGQLPIISFMTLAELEQWTAVRNWGPRRRQELLNYLRRYKVEHSSPELCRRWAEVSDGAPRRDIAGNAGRSRLWVYLQTHCKCSSEANQKQSSEQTSGKPFAFHVQVGPAAGHDALRARLRHRRRVGRCRAYSGRARADLSHI